MALEVFDFALPGPDHLDKIHPLMLMAGIPHRMHSSGCIEYERVQGRLAYVVEAGRLRNMDGRVKTQLLPSGSLPRLLLIEILSKTDSDEYCRVDLKSLQASVLERCNLWLSTPAELIWEQFAALVACSVQISAWDGRRSQTCSYRFFGHYEMSDRQRGREDCPFSSVWLDSDFVQRIKRHQIPSGLIETLGNIATSPRKIELVCWLIWKVSTSKARLTVSWAVLMLLFNSEDRDDREFETTLQADLSQIGVAFPKLLFALSDQGLTLETQDISVFGR